ncbi:ferredoxin [Actinoplanes siamensis]|uniref:Ferredoxin n=1 Tax=Actinoplanes siamensis TaxID=1223317 RepID=A0A919TJW1_9ACTN|nr:hypothetical protein [Actinoplanes siamensis]GIF04749.1 hypothetical protein Asi03nite_22870 [Actinoplanes siamensis]
MNAFGFEDGIALLRTAEHGGDQAEDVRQAAVLCPAPAILVED